MSDKTKNILLIIAAVLLIVLAVTSGILYKQYKTAESNVVMWNDSTYYYKNKYNEEYLAKNTYILKAEQLKEYNDSLYKEYTALKDHPIVITKTNVITRIDTIRATIDSLWSDSLNTTWLWSAQDSCWYDISGSNMLTRRDGKFVVCTNIDKLIIANGITLDVVDNGEQLIVLAKSNNPYTDINEIQSVVIDPTTSPTLKKYFKDKRWGFGPYIGICAYTGYGWMPNTGNKAGFQVGFGGSIGFSIHYNLVQW